MLVSNTPSLFLFPPLYFFLSSRLFLCLPPALLPLFSLIFPAILILSFPYLSEDRLCGELSRPDLISVSNENPWQVCHSVPAVQWKRDASCHLEANDTVSTGARADVRPPINSPLRGRGVCLGLFHTLVGCSRAFFRFPCVMFLIFVFVWGFKTLKHIPKWEQLTCPYYWRGAVCSSHFCSDFRWN